MAFVGKIVEVAVNKVILQDEVRNWIVIVCCDPVWYESHSILSGQNGIVVHCDVGIPFHPDAFQPVVQDQVVCAPRFHVSVFGPIPQNALPLIEPQVNPAANKHNLISLEENEIWWFQRALVAREQTHEVIREKEDLISYTSRGA